MFETVLLKILGALVSIITLIGGGAGFIFWLFATFSTITQSSLQYYDMNIRLTRDQIKSWESRKIAGEELPIWEGDDLVDAKFRLTSYLQNRKKLLGVR